MRSRLLGGLVCVAGLGAALACGPRSPRPVALTPLAAATSEDAAAPPEPEPSAYVIGGNASGLLAARTAVALGKSETGFLVEGVRVTVNGARVRVSSEVATVAITAVAAVPERLGGGFLFWNESALYHAPEFGGKLRGIAYFPEGKIGDVVFGFDRLLVRGADGQRWMLRLPSGERVAMQPPGVVDLLARAEGLGLALTDAGRVLATLDAGKSWQDVTAQAKGPPASLAAREDALYVTTSEGNAARLAPDGRLTRVDQVPAEPKPDRDPRWRSGESPLRLALRLGVSAEDPGTAIVASLGDLVRVSLRSGEILAVQPGKLPPDSTCEGVRTADDAVFLCQRGQDRLVVSGTLYGNYGKSPRIEQSFVGGLVFYASDDGAIAYGGPCSGPPRDGVVCVRGASGSWLERGGQSDGGAAAPVGIVVPRADGGASSLTFQGRSATLLDLVTGEARSFADGELPSGNAGRSSSKGSVRREWSFAPDGTLLGWLGGKSVVIPAAGAPSATVFVGENAVYGTAGPRALGMTPTGRLYQTLDRGVTWAEVAPPPSQNLAVDATRATGSIQCGELGCVLGPWLRVGFPEESRRAGERRVQAPPPAEVKAFASARSLACEPQGPLRGKSLPADKDLAFGATFVPSGLEATPLARASLHPVLQDSSETDEPARRALSLAAPDVFRHRLTYVAPFDPLASPHVGLLTAADVARAQSTTPSGDDLTSGFSFTRALPITPLDPAGASGLLFAGDRLVFLLRGGVARVSLLPDESGLVPISVAEVAGDEHALLLSNGIHSSVHRVSRQGVLAPVMAWSGPDDAERYPRNPDAVAVGPRGEIGVIRLASGVEPASEQDPARLLLPKGREVKLAPWAALVAADDAACKADPSGFRATVQVQDWLRLDDASQRPEPSSHMWARVRWSEARICLEGLEARVRGTEGDRREAGKRYEQWLVHRTLPSPQSGFVSIGAGFEFRQAARCVLR